MQLIVLILAVLVEVWFSIFRVQLREEQRSWEAGKHTRALQLLPWTAALTAPRPFQASLSGGTMTLD